MKTIMVCLQYFSWEASSENGEGVVEDVSILIYTKVALKFVSQKSDLKIGKTLNWFRIESKRCLCQ
jgi:hypothetical protein